MKKILPLAELIITTAILGFLALPLGWVWIEYYPNVTERVDIPEFSGYQLLFQSFGKTGNAYGYPAITCIFMLLILVLFASAVGEFILCLKSKKIRAFFIENLILSIFAVLFLLLTILFANISYGISEYGTMYGTMGSGGILVLILLILSLADSILSLIFFKTEE